ncbi:hypothetical protein ABUE34_00795 [Kozakia baliensis]|uniref:hypothetical protein n=1 Tax=Kozakia baliensis TaxID=153496 RepID=UPI00345B874C
MSQITSEFIEQAARKLVSGATKRLKKEDAIAHHFRGGPCSVVLNAVLGACLEEFGSTITYEAASFYEAVLDHRVAEQVKRCNATSSPA